MRRGSVLLGIDVIPCDFALVVIERYKMGTGDEIDIVL